MDLDGRDAYSIQYQNANNSVRVTDEFMRAFEQDQDWKLKAVTTGETVETVARARADARDRPGGVGVRRPRACSTTPRSTSGTRARRRAASTRSNPCSEYMHLDNSACNLASLNLMKFLDDDGQLRRGVASGTRSRSCSPRRRSWWASPTTRPRRSARTRGPTGSWGSATRTSAPC